MVAVALLVGDSAHATTTKASSALTTAGHSVTVVSDVNVGSTDFSGYAVVVSLRTDASRVAAVGDVLKALSVAGKPIIVDAAISSFSDGEYFTGVPTYLGLTGQCLGASAENEIYVLNNAHPVTTGLASGAVTYSSSTGYLLGFQQSAVLPAAAGVFADDGSAILALGDDDDSTLSNLISLAVLDPGVDLPGGVRSGARIAIAPVYVGGTAATAYNTLIANLMTWVQASATNNDRLKVFSKRAYVVTGPSKSRLSVNNFRAYVVTGPSMSKLAVNAFRAYAVHAPRSRTGSEFTRKGAGSWSGADSVSHQWAKSPDGETWDLIDAATADEYTAQAEDEGNFIANMETATNENGSTTVRSNARGPVMPTSQFSVFEPINDQVPSSSTYTVRWDRATLGGHGFLINGTTIGVPLNVSKYRVHLSIAHAERITSTPKILVNNVEVASHRVVSRHASSGGFSNYTSVAISEIIERGEGDELVSAISRNYITLANIQVGIETFLAIEVMEMV